MKTRNVSIYNIIVIVIAWTIQTGSYYHIEGNNFKTIKIGSQIWMAENLDVDKFSNGDLIPHAQTRKEWYEASEKGQPAWCYYENDPANSDIHGKLYNWHAVNDRRGLAPAGWHVPSNIEWHELIDFLGGMATADEKMKSNKGWSAASNGNNQSGFSGTPGGYRFVMGFFGRMGDSGYWWSATESKRNTKGAWYCKLDYYNSYVDSTIDLKGTGFSVRCIKN